MALVGNVSEYEFGLANFLEANYEDENIIKLHRLGYLPLEIRALPEGTLVPMGFLVLKLQILIQSLLG